MPQEQVGDGGLFPACAECSVLGCCCWAVRVPAGADSVLLCLLRATDAGLLYLRRIKDLAPPDDEDQRPACVDMRVRVSSPHVTGATDPHAHITPAVLHCRSCHVRGLFPCEPAVSVAAAY
jgi:hypothetical protein